MLPFVFVAIMLLTVIIIICVYLKENLKLSKIFGRKGREARPDKDFENEILRREFASGGHVEL